MTRIEKRFAQLAEKGETAFVSYVMAGDPDIDTSLDLIQDLPSAGVDILEIGIPFTDPMADGPTIQLAATRSLEGGASLAKVLNLVERFRVNDNETPVVLMGYYNPIHQMGVDRFLERAKSAGVDGMIVVDLPPEEDNELTIPANKAGLNFIRLTTPTTNDARLPAVSKNTSGFVYYVSVNGITGAAAANAESVAPEVARIKAATGLPVCVGFGVRDPETSAAIGAVADGVVVGSAIVKMVEEGKPKAEILEFVRGLAQGAKSND